MKIVAVTICSAIALACSSLFPLVECQVEVPRFAGLVGNDTMPIAPRSISTFLDIRGYAVGVECNLTYVNTESSNVNIEFIFPLDAEAAVYKLEARIGNRKIVGKIFERSKAEEIYNNAVAKQQKAALLQSQLDSSDVYRLLIGNLNAGQQITITIAYAQPIERDYNSGMFKFALPMVLNPRDIAAGILTNPALIRQQYHLRSQWIAVNAASQPYNMTFSGTVDLRKAANEIKSVRAGTPADNLQVEFDSKTEATFRLTNPFRADHDFVLLIDVVTNDRLWYGMFEEPGLSMNYYGPNNRTFMHSLVAGVWVDQSISKIVNDTMDSCSCDEFWFVVDRSRSMNDKFYDEYGIPTSTKMDTALQAMRTFIKSLPTGAKFNILGFGGYGCPQSEMALYNSLFPEVGNRYCDKDQSERIGYVNYRDRAVPADEENVQAVLNYIDNDMKADVWGNSLILNPLKYIYDLPPPETGRRHIFLVTDGEVDNFEEIIAAVGRRKATNKVYTVGVGDGASTMLKRVARVSGGASEFVRNKTLDRVADKVGRLMTYARSASIDNVNMTFILAENAGNTITHSRNIPSSNNFDTAALHGRSTALFGVFWRALDNQMVDAILNISASIKGVPFSARPQVSFDRRVVSGRADPMPLHRLAAKRLLNDLVDTYYIFDESESIKNQAIAFSIESGILCEWTSLVAIDEETNSCPYQETRSIGTSSYSGGIGQSAVAQPSLVGIVNSQRFDGSWELTDELAASLRSPDIETGEGLYYAINDALATSGVTIEYGDANADIRATLACVSALHYSFGHIKYEAALIQQKAMEYLKSATRNQISQQQFDTIRLNLSKRLKF